MPKEHLSRLVFRESHKLPIPDRKVLFPCTPLRLHGKASPQNSIKLVKFLSKERCESAVSALDYKEETPTQKQTEVEGGNRHENC